jgi:protein-L-isoaspartate(D-aspartate) O-methyltransferase
MVESQLYRRGIRDARVLQAFREIPRHEFVRAADARYAYEDYPISIGYDQTISQPYIVAQMVEALELRGPETVLEVGAGSGYQAAILARLASRVYAIERYPALAEIARRNLGRASLTNVTVVVGDGSLGYPIAAPYDAIVVAAGAPHISAALVEQLAEGGRLVIPVGTLESQELRQIRKLNGKTVSRVLGHCRFVPLTGVGGWQTEFS